MSYRLTLCKNANFTQRPRVARVLRVRLEVFKLHMFTTDATRAPTMPLETSSCEPWISDHEMRKIFVFHSLHPLRLAAPLLLKLTYYSQ